MSKGLLVITGGRGVKQHIYLDIGILLRK